VTADYHGNVIDFITCGGRTTAYAPALQLKPKGGKKVATKASKGKKAAASESLAGDQAVETETPLAEKLKNAQPKRKRAAGTGDVSAQAPRGRKQPEVEQAVSEVAHDQAGLMRRKGRSKAAIVGGESVSRGSTVRKTKRVAAADVDGEANALVEVATAEVTSPAGKVVAKAVDAAPVSGSHGRAKGQRRGGK
jgi:hypothetical protein